MNLLWIFVPAATILVSATTSLSGFPRAASRSDGLLGVPSGRIRCGNQCSETRGPQGGGDCSADASIPIGSTRRDYSDAEVETIAEW